jgi:hypothetical protein
VVFPELSGGDRLLEVRVSRGNHTRIHMNLLAAADPLKHSLLQESQQFHLHRRRQFPDLIQK